MSAPFLKHLRVLQNLPLFSHLGENQLITMLEKSTAALRSYSQSQIIAQKGDVLDELLILVTGHLSADVLSIEGKSFKVETLAPPSLVASTILFADDSVFPVQLTAIRDSELIAIPQSQLLHIATADPVILQNLLRDSGNRLQFLAEKLTFIQFSSIEKKLARYLLDLHLRQKVNPLTLPHSIQVLSELFGVTRPSLSRVVGTLEETGIISKVGKQISITNIDELTNILE